jgi:hypothetical protein
VSPTVVSKDNEVDRILTKLLTRLSIALNNSIALRPKNTINCIDSVLSRIEELPIFDRRYLRRFRVDFSADFERFRGKEAT